MLTNLVEMSWFDGMLTSTSPYSIQHLVCSTINRDFYCYININKWCLLLPFVFSTIIIVVVPKRSSILLIAMELALHYVYFYLRTSRNTILDYK